MAYKFTKLNKGDIAVSKGGYAFRRLSLTESGGAEESYTLSGTWVFNEVLTAPSKNIYADFNFRFDAWLDQYLEGYYHYPYEYGMLIVGSPYPSSPIEGDGWWLGYECQPEHVEQCSMYESKRGWIRDDYRTFTFVGTQTVSKEFYDWFMANAARQEIMFFIDIDGRTDSILPKEIYRALSGMTWGEWVESDYNTGGWFIYWHANTKAVFHSTYRYLKNSSQIGVAGYRCETEDMVIEPDTNYETAYI